MYPVYRSVSLSVFDETTHTITGEILMPVRASEATWNGTLREGNTLVVEGANILYGRWENASLGFFGAGSETLLPGSIHWIVAPSGYPSYLSDVLTGVAAYTLAGATSPTNQHNVAGTFGGQAVLNVNFTSRPNRSPASSFGFS